MARAVWLWGPPALYALAIFVISSLSVVPSPPGSFSDKHVHGLVYAGLALMIVRAWAGGAWSAVTYARAWRAGLLAVAYGATDEWHQSFVPGRDASLADLGADTLGAALAVVAVVALARLTCRDTRADGTIERSAGGVGQTP